MKELNIVLNTENFISFSLNTALYVCIHTDYAPSETTDVLNKIYSIKI